ncbi:cysteine synthase A [bacterium]|nr:MAG: cysteine synthase A [bacterium]
MVAPDILRTIGRTPSVRLARLFPDHEVYQKQERTNPGGSIKDRVALAMIEDAEARGLLTRETVIIEPTSGNTGIGLAMVCAVKGYRLILVMPESMTVERRKIMAAYGAEFELTPKEKGMKGAIARAEEMVAEHHAAWMPSQFDNPANIEVHRRTTALEVIEDFPDGLDYLITAVGTGGHITGMSDVLKKSWPDLKVLAVEPEKSPVISGGEPSPHRIQGIGAGFIPGNLHRDAIDGTVQVSEDESMEWARLSARHEGILVGISTGASLAAVAKTLPTLPKDARVLTCCYDTGERYLSIEGFLG